MSDMISDASAWLDAQRTEHLSHSVVYVRGTDSITATATIGRTIFRFDNAFGIQERYESRDYLILSADLEIDGEVVIPIMGDKIKELVGETTFVYEIMAPGGEPCWRYSDPYRRTLRIHTKYIGPETVS